MHHAIARTIVEMKLKPGFEAFQAAKADENAGKLYAHLHHLVAPGTDLARGDLGELMRVAHQLTLDMYSLPLQFAFEFPGVGAIFDPSCMVNHDPEVTGDPLGLQRRRVRVRLGVSPITVKREVTAAAIVPQTIHYAKVLLMA